jgi:hypothetical protein
LLPVTEKQIRPITILPEDEQAQAWQEAVEEAEAEGKAAPTHVIVDRVVKRRKAKKLPKPPQPTKADLAHRAAETMQARADGFTSAVGILMDHIEHLEDHEAQGCAYKIVETVHGVLDILREHGHLRREVAEAMPAEVQDSEVVSVH